MGLPISKEAQLVSFHTVFKGYWGECGQRGGYFEMINIPPKKIHPLERQQVEDMKEEVRRMLLTDHDTCSEKLELIDKIQRLGVSYHFEAEIKASLQIIFEAYSECNSNIYGDDLYVVALGFRLLRQQGYFVSSDVFEKFKDNEGNFEKALTTNVPAMLCFYEAAHMRVHGEDILEQALVFTSSHL